MTSMCRPPSRSEAASAMDVDSLCGALSGQQDACSVLSALTAVHAQRQSLAQVLLNACAKATGSCPASAAEGSTHAKSPTSTSGAAASSSSAPAGASSDSGSEQTCSICHALDLLHANVLRERSLLLQVIDMLLAQVRCCCHLSCGGTDAPCLRFVTSTVSASDTSIAQVSPTTSCADSTLPRCVWPCQCIRRPNGRRAVYSTSSCSFRPS